MNDESRKEETAKILDNGTLTLELSQEETSEEVEVFLDIPISDQIDSRITEIDEKLDGLSEQINQWSSGADRLDLSLAAISGLISGLIDIFFIGKWDFKSAKIASNIEINKSVIDFAMKDPDYRKKYAPTGIEGRLETALSFLEKKYKLPGDGEWKCSDVATNAKTHHLDDYCHHPTLIGLICCVIVQFDPSQSIRYHSSKGDTPLIPVTINEYGDLIGILIPLKYSLAL